MHDRSLQAGDLVAVREDALSAADRQVSLLAHDQYFRTVA
jgi:hypothetical protein